MLGENGAGKTTLMHVAYGLVRPEGGEIRVNGVPSPIASPREARRLGIGMVHQHFTVGTRAECRGKRRAGGGLAGRSGGLRRGCGTLSERLGLPLEPRPSRPAACR